MTRFTVAALFLAACTLVAPRRARAEDNDYDVQSGAWNGLQELVRVAQTAEVDLRPSAVLDWEQLRRGEGLLVLYPRSGVELADLSSFLEDGGRLALFDDYGDAAPLLHWFQVARSEEPRGQPRSVRVPGLLLAYKRMEHPLADGVDALTTNEPVVLFHPRLAPVFALSDDPRQGVVLAGQVGRGRLVLGGDPSVLINTMMRFPGNRQFARNLLVYLAGHAGGRVHLVHSGFTARGIYRGRGHAHHPAREVVRNVNELLSRLSTIAGDPLAVRWMALIVATAAMLALALRAWGARPSDRFGPTGPPGVAAAVGDKVEIFSRAAANMLYPSLIAKRYFERVLLRAVGLAPPTDVGAVLARAQGRLTPEQERSLRSVLVELDQIATAPEDGGPSRIAPARFLSLWRKISAILTALGES